MTFSWMIRGTLLAIFLAQQFADGRVRSTQTADAGTPKTQAASAPSVPWLTVRILPSVSYEVLEFLAATLEPSATTLYPGESLQSLALKYYGNADGKIIRLLRSHNPALPALRTAPVSVILPAGPYWRVDERLPIPTNSTVWQQTELNMGVAAGPAMRDVASANQRTVAGLDVVLAGERIVFPYVAHPVSFRFRSEHVAEASAIVGLLEGRDGVRSVSITLPRLVSQWTRAELMSAGIAMPDEEKDANWAFRSLPRSLPPLNGSVPVTVAIVDSGIVPDDPQFKFWHNGREASRGRVNTDDDGNGYFDDIIGVDLTRQIPGFFPEDDLSATEYAWHGTHVAGLVSGRVLGLSRRPELDKAIQLMILKVADRFGEVKPSAVGNAILYSSKYNARVVNMSFEMAFDATIIQFLRDHENLLFVVAAGNGVNRIGVDLDNESIYPARLGGRDAGHIVSVAAHDSNGFPASFSNFGFNTVDLAAPGLDVTSTVKDGFARLSGTSQATPLVSLTAALLFGAGLQTPVEVKNRILASVDFSPKYANKVWSQGALNIEKALSISQDWIERGMPDERRTVVRGKILSPTSIRLPNGRVVSFHEIGKIVRRYDLKGQPIQFRLQDPEGLLTLQEVIMDLPDLLVDVGGEVVTIPGAELLDVVPAIR